MHIRSAKTLARLMALEDVSTRALARAAGWRSHTYLLRVLSGEVTSVTPERAERIAEALGVTVPDLFTEAPPEAVAREPVSA